MTALRPQPLLTAPLQHLRATVTRPLNVQHRLQPTPPVPVLAPVREAVALAALRVKAEPADLEVRAAPAVKVDLALPEAGALARAAALADAAVAKAVASVAP